MPDTTATRALSVLVVDDSAVVRQFMSHILSRDGGVAVRVAADPIFARAKIEQQRPDVILLDLETPRMHGLDFLRELMRTDPIPVVICSSYVGPGSDTALRALEEGALDLVSKPEFGVREFLEDNATMLLDKLRAAAVARVPARACRLGNAQPPRPSVAASTTYATTDTVIAIGASTGGTDAIQTILQALPPDAPPVLVTQHMPAGFTNSFASRLDALCHIAVKEAENGDRLRPGRALIAPGNQHMRLIRDGGHLCVELQGGPLVSRHRPSVDVLFDSVAQLVGSRGVGVILTGMGDDGARGLLHMRQGGALTIAQDEATCVVYGMPREAVLRGAVERIAPIGAIAGLLMQHSARPVPAAR